MHEDPSFMEFLMAHAWVAGIVALALIGGVVFLIYHRRAKFRGFGISLGDPTGAVDPKVVAAAKKKKR